MKKDTGKYQKKDTAGYQKKRASRTSKAGGNTRKAKRKQLVKVLFIFLILALAGAAWTVYHNYQISPGILEKVWVSDRGADYITVAWEKPRNIHKFVVMYDGKTVKAPGQSNDVRITGLNEDTEYKFEVRADSSMREGTNTLTTSAKTKKNSHIEGKSDFYVFANTEIDLKQTAEMPVTYTSENGSIEIQNGKVVFTRPGKVKIIAKTASNEVYVGTTKEITVEVLDTVNVDARGATPHIFYKLNKSNCKAVKAIKGEKEAQFPQSFVCYKGKYIISYVNKEGQRIITYGDKRKVHKPKQDLGHANGLALANGICYSVRGGLSGKVVTFDTSIKKYKSFDLPYDASGIAYDEKANMFYTSSARGFVAYDSDFNVVNRVGMVHRDETSYVQDCGAYGGIMLHCVSGSDEQGTNYIDFYDMNYGRYLGSIECELNEVESLLIDDEGYIELLSNTRNNKDYIWKTPFNIKKLCDD